MLRLASRPWDYLIVGALALAVGLGSGAVIGALVGADDGPVITRIEPAPLIIGKRPEDIAIPIPQKPEETTEVADAEEAEDDPLTPPPLTDLQQSADLADQMAAIDLPKPQQKNFEAEAMAWERNSVTVADPAGKPMIAVVIDDLGLNRRNTVRTIRLPGPLTLAFMTYAEDLERQTSSAHAAGHELMVHFPMGPKNDGLDTGPNPLLRDLDDEEIRRRLDWGLSRFDGFVGVNNHMGSNFTNSARGMKIVMDEMRKRGLLFLDSLTTQGLLARRFAARGGVPFIARDVFVDNELDAKSIEYRLAQVEAVARRQGYAIAIGHPHTATLEALEVWLPKLVEAGFALVPVSTVIRHRSNM